MPLYDYDCAACGRRFEVIHGVHADSPDACPVCGGGPVRKAVTAPAVHFKGSGWAKKERRSAATSGTSGDKDGSTSDPKHGDAAASDRKGSEKKEPATAASASPSAAESSSSSSSSSKRDKD